MCVCVCVRACARARVCERERVSVCVLRARACVLARGRAGVCVRVCVSGPVRGRNILYLVISKPEQLIEGRSQNNITDYDTVEFKV